MAYAPYNISVVQGDGESRKFVWDLSGSPVDIETWVIFTTVKKLFSHDDSRAVISYDSVNDTTAIVKSDSASNGFDDQFHINYLAADTDIPPGDYITDIKIIIDGADPWTVFMGIYTAEDHATDRVTT
ncbi:MAG: hypothetical protein JRC86_02790 [Deltaproteobacteria bacterium]|nr:hypothetical protein [Deltaproteobacteria bacterium]